MKILSGTQRARPYNLDYSMLSSIDNGYQQIGLMAGMYDRWEYDFRSMALSSQEMYRNIAPNISSIDLHNLTAIRSDYGAGMLAHNNLNMLSINLDNLQTISANYGLSRFASGTKVRCDLPSLASVSGNYALQRAWSLVDPNNELQVQERLMPNLTSVIGQYAMNYAFYNYVFTQ